MRLGRVPHLAIRAALAVAVLATAACPVVAAVPKAQTDAASKPVAIEIRARAGGRLKAFYGPRGFWPLWVHNGKIGPEADALLRFLATADSDGLNPEQYRIGSLKALIAEARGGDARALAKAELGLSQTFADYARDMRRAPSVKITYLDAEVQPVRLRADAVLRAAALPPSFADYVKTMGWMSPLYVRLRAALAQSKAPDGKTATARIIRLNLDRARLLPGPWTRHIVVDAASARLWYYDNGKQQGTMRVVAGAARTQTPMLAGMVRYAILNPYWNVPSDLVENRLAPKVLGGASLKALGYEVLSDWSANPQKLDPKTIDWHAVAAGQQEARVRQLPGATNAMGHVKFMFPNDLGIYLHDTPEKALFAKSARHLSNGCVRLEDAARLGQWLLGKPLAAAGKAPEQDVPLAAPVPVYLTYLTAVPGEHGVTLLNDAYHRDGDR
jgi:murein L,D-transpeptidase YcbB/YkuD